MLKRIVVEPGVLMGYKIFPGSQFVTSNAAQGQSQADWSGLYAQFNIQHAVAYLPNHFDRGYETAMLVSIHTRKPIKCLLYENTNFSRAKVSSSDKADALRSSIGECIPSKRNEHDKP